RDVVLETRQNSRSRAPPNCHCRLIEIWHAVSGWGQHEAGVAPIDTQYSDLSLELWTRETPGTGSLSRESQARSNLYPTDKTIEPTKRPMIPIAIKPPIAPKKTTRMGTGTPRPSSSGFRTLSMRATTMHQIKKAADLAGPVVAKT